MKMTVEDTIKRDISGKFLEQLTMEQFIWLCDTETPFILNNVNMGCMSVVGVIHSIGTSITRPEDGAHHLYSDGRQNKTQWSQEFNEIPSRPMEISHTIKINSYQDQLVTLRFEANTGAGQWLVFFREDFGNKTTHDLMSGHDPDAPRGLELFDAFDGRKSEFDSILDISGRELTSLKLEDFKKLLNHKIPFMLDGGGRAYWIAGFTYKCTERITEPEITLELGSKSGSLFNMAIDSTVIRLRHDCLNDPSKLAEFDRLTLSMKG